MTNTNQEDKVKEIIKQKGIGKYLGKLKNGFEEKEIYLMNIGMCLTNGGKYFVIMHKNFCLPSSFHPEQNLTQIPYEGYNKNEAERIFNEVIEKDKKDKQTLVDKTFSRN